MSKALLATERDIAQGKLRFLFTAPGAIVVSQDIRIFPRGAHARGKGRKNTPGKMCRVFVLSAGMLAEPIKFEHSK